MKNSGFFSWLKGVFASKPGRVLVSFEISGKLDSDMRRVMKGAGLPDRSALYRSMWAVYAWIYKMFEGGYVIAAIDPAARDEEMREAVEEREIAFGLRGIVLRGGHRGFRFARIDHDDFRVVRIAQHALPHDGMGDAKV